MWTNKNIISIATFAVALCSATFTSCDKTNVQSAPQPELLLKEFNPDKMEQLNKDFIVREARLTPEEQQIVLPIVFHIKSEKRQLRHDMRGMTRRVEREPEISEKDCEKILEQIKQCREDIAILNRQLIDELKANGISAKKILLIQAADNKFKRVAFKKMALHEEKQGQPHTEQ